MSETPGRKDDSGKLRFDLLPVEPLKKVVDAYTMGAKKYGDRNWEKGLEWGRVYAAMQRHSWAWWGGEIHDRADGQHHLASVVWCALSLMEYEDKFPQLDSRPSKYCTCKDERVVKASDKYVCMACSKELN